eukprot:955076-Amphidinium_carterae.1
MAVVIDEVSLATHVQHLGNLQHTSTGNSVDEQFRRTTQQNVVKKLLSCPRICGIGLVGFQCATSSILLDLIASSTPCLGAIQAIKIGYIEEQGMKTHLLINHLTIGEHPLLQEKKELGRQDPSTQNDSKR